MEFTTQCFIRKYTKKLRYKLEKLGYGEYAIIKNNIEGNCIAVNQTKFITGFITISELDGIDCGTNEQLFFAIAALRNDTDINQWFILQDGSWVKCECDSRVDMWGDFDEEIGEKYPRKATVTELIEHFK